MSDTSTETRRALEAVLMVAEIPVEPQLLAQLLEIPVLRVVELCEALAAEYEESERGFVLVQVAGERPERDRSDQRKLLEELRHRVDDRQPDRGHVV